MDPVFRLDLAVLIVVVKPLAVGAQHIRGAPRKHVPGVFLADGFRAERHGFPFFLFLTTRRRNTPGVWDTMILYGRNAQAFS